MNKYSASDTSQDRELRDDELDAVTGGSPPASNDQLMQMLQQTLARLQGKL
jgi:hypothetical protein